MIKISGLVFNSDILVLFYTKHLLSFCFFCVCVCVCVWEVIGLICLHLYTKGFFLV